MMLMQIPAQLFHGWFASRFGSARSLFYLYIICACVFTVYAGTAWKLGSVSAQDGTKTYFIPNLRTKYPKLNLAFAGISMCVLTAAYQTMYILTSDISPTDKKSGIFAFCNLLARPASMLSPQLGEKVWDGSKPFWLWSALSILCLVLFFFYDPDALKNAGEAEGEEEIKVDESRNSPKDENPEDKDNAEK